MSSQHPTDYLRLSQFLDLQSQWLTGLSALGEHDQGELAHRICATAVFLLDPAAVAIGLETEQRPYGLLASHGAWPRQGNGDGSAPEGRAAQEMACRALATRTAQLKSRGDVTDGIFPFSAGTSGRGCLHVRIDRPLFEGREVAFLRFLASLAGIALAAGLGSLVQDRELASESDRPRSQSEDEARRYVAMVVHDLRNPLNVVSGYAGLLEDGSLGELSTEQREAVEAINRQVTALLAVIEQLMDIDGLSSPTRTLTADTFDLRSLFDELATTCFPHADERLGWPGPESAFEFTTDRRRLFSIVQNLVDNALKHAAEAPVTIDCSRRDKRLHVSVADRGPGIASEHRATLLGRTSTRSEPGKRSGIGLYAVAAYVHALGGTVEISDRDGGGTIVSVSLPRLAPGPVCS